jgi:MFS family permease
VKTKLPRPVILLGFAALLNDAASEMIYPLLPIFLTATLGASPAILGIVEGAADGLASILKYFSGRFSDRTGRRKPLVVAGYGLAAAARALIAAATAWPLVLVARLTDRTGKGLRSAPRDAMISDVTPAADRGRAYGFHRALDHTGAIIGPLLAVLLLQGFGFTLRQTFFFAVIPGFVAALMLIWLLRERTPAESADAGAASTPHEIRHGRTRLGRALVPIAFFSLANSSDAFLLLQAHQAGVATAMLPLLWAAHHVVKSLFSTRAGALSDRVGRTKLLVAGWTLYAVIYALFPFARSLTAFVVLFVVYAIPFTLTEGAERAWIADLVPREERGRSFGLYYLVSGAAVLVGTVLFGVLYEMTSPEIAFFTGAALSLAAAATVGLRGARD